MLSRRAAVMAALSFTVTLTACGLIGRPASRSSSPATQPTKTATLTPPTQAPATTAPRPTIPNTTESRPAAPATTLPGQSVFRRTIIGYSVRGRPIVAVEMGNPAASHRILVIAAIHGDETSGIAIVRALEARPRPANLDLWIIEALNPDAVATGTRLNAHGVDLNRNFPYLWVLKYKPWDGEYTGPSPASEPETHAAMAFIARIRPEATIWYHSRQTPLIDESGGASVALEQRYAQLVGLPLVQLTRYPGSGIGWENHALSGTTAFAAEIASGTPSSATVQRHVNAVLALFGSL